MNTYECETFINVLNNIFLNFFIIYFSETINP